jgi:2-polyprenyl-6-methoxyphenol hydroxylase-like FAD-dependent oxidoreductase
VLDALADHAPPIRERIDPKEFALTRPVDLLQGSITPTVRHGWSEVAEGKYAVAVGDAWVVNDPIVGQGANLGSRSAFTLADEIVGGPPYDESFCRRVGERLWTDARPSTEWSNAFLAPPPPHAIEILAAATGDSRVADAFANNFNEPAAMWDVLSSPQNTADWLIGLRRPAAPATAGQTH